MNPLEQGLLYGVTVIVLLGTLIAFVVQYLRGRRRDRDGSDGSGEGDDGKD